MKVIILAGGLGTRLSEETHKIPKPMLEIGDKPILWHILKTYSYYGYNESVICLGYKGDVIRDYFLGYRLYSRDFTINIGHDEPIKYWDNDEDKWRVTLAETGALTTTGGRLLIASRYLSGDKMFMLTYGDGLADVDINDLVDFHNKSGKLATITAVRPPSRFGEISIEEGTVLGFAEKPQLGRGWISGGFMVFNKDALELANSKSSLEEGLLTNLSNEKQLAVYQHNGSWGCVDTQRELQEMNSLWNTNKAFWKVW